MTKEKSAPIFTLDNLKRNVLNLIVGIVITAGTTLIFKSYNQQQDMLVELELMKKDIAIIKQQSDSQNSSIQSLDKLTTRLEILFERGGR